MTLANSSSSSRSASLLGSLAFGLSLAVFAAAPGCSDDTVPATTGGAGSTGTAGTAGAGGGTSDSGSGTGGSGDASAVLCAKSQMASEIGDHCVDDGGMMIKKAANVCPTTPGDAAAQDDGGAEMYPPAHSGTIADDDDCKYHVVYGITPCQPDGVFTLNLTLTSRTETDADGGAKGVTGAKPSIEADLDGHPLPNPAPVTTEVGNGEYKIAGVRFDKEGAWVVRFHFFEMCLETDENTKHGHVAFNVIVQ